MVPVLKKTGYIDLTKPNEVSNYNDIFKKKDPKSPKLPFIEETEALPGLVPLGDTGFYINPDQAVDPEDCSLWPDSPYCGGNPFTLEPIGLEFQYIANECDIGISITPVLGFIKLPPIQIVKKNVDNPDCLIKPDTPQKPIITDNGLEDVILQPLPPGCRYVCWFIRVIRHYFVYTTPEKTIDKATLSETVISYKPEFIGFDGDEIVSYKGFYIGNGIGGTSLGRTGGGGVNYFVLENDLAEDVTDVGFHQLFIEGYENVEIESHVIKPRFGTKCFHTKMICKPGSAPLSMYFAPPPPPKLPPLPPPEKEKMNCCPQLLVAIAQLKLLVIENSIKINQLSEVVGVDEYPASLPASLISKDEGFIGNLIPNPNIEVKSLTSLLGWFFERFDEIMGEWEIPIQIKDTDPTTPGDQPKGIRLPNLAETLAELFSMAFQNTVNNDLLINILTRNLVETGQVKQQGFKSYGLLQTLVDYFNYDYADVSKDLALSFVPNKLNFDEMLKDTTIQVAYPEYRDKDDFKKSLYKLLEAAAIIKAVNWRKIDTKGDVKAQFIEKVKAQANMLKAEAERQGISLDAFLIEAEKGFPSTPGMPDPGEPYGEPFEDRPIITKLQEEP